MKKLIDVLCSQIIQQVHLGKTNIIRLECFDDPRVYSAVSAALKGKVDYFIAKLSKEKYEEFQVEARAEWAGSILSLHQGSNDAYCETPSSAYITNSYVDFNNAITKWRNESANIGDSVTSLILLMGTESATDVGGLLDTSFVISPKELVASLREDYSKWFWNTLKKNAIDSSECRKAIHTLYRALFTSVNINIFSFSSFVDELDGMTFGLPQDLINYICETLNRVWNIPSIINSRFVPKIQTLCKGKLSGAKIITDAVRFIDRIDDIPSERRVEGLKKQFEKYAETMGLDVSAPFPADQPVFPTFHTFRSCTIDYMCGKSIDNNRELLLKVDYAIIASILGMKPPKTIEQKPAPVSGEPLEALSKIFLDAANSFYEDKKLYPLSFLISVDRITLSNCTEDQKEEAFMPIASFLGGIMSFFEGASIEYNGELLSFAYDEEYGNDPFDYSNYDSVKDRIRCTGKWGDPCKIQLNISLSNGDISKKYEYKWVFSPYSAWPNAFLYLCNVIFRNGGDSYVLPTMIACDNIQDYLGCESEDEFYAQLLQLRDSVLFDQHRKEIHKYFAGTEISGLFDVVCTDFKDFALSITQHGLYYALEKLRSTVKSYTSLMEAVARNYSIFTDIQREKLPLILNCFTITSNTNIIANCDLAEALVPAYNPVMLEKIDAKQLFIRDGFTELMSKKLDGEPAKNESALLRNYAQMASITQGLDTIYKRSSEYMTCKAMWEYFGVYYTEQAKDELLSGNSFGLSIVTDDEDASAMLRSTPMSSILVRNVSDYIQTFPARIDGLNITIIAPSDMQHIVSAIHSIAKKIEADESSATINLRLVCLNSKKNSAAYLRKWLDSYFSEERGVRVNTYLCNITLQDSSDIDYIAHLLKNCDLCFTYDLLTSTGVQFAPSGDTSIDKDLAKFPMTFTPDTVTATHGKSRRVNVSQFQFIASKAHTQASYIVGYPNSKTGLYRTFRTLELKTLNERIIEMAHDYCKWVVCIDPAIDRSMLDEQKNKIIGFTTGEGCYGELNVTVSARKDILADIKTLLKKRITEKFKNWDNARLKKAADYCVDSLSQYMDGSRILKALNPYDYEIHNYLAYILSVQMLNLSTVDDGYIIRSLISLDSYRHWFDEDDDKIRPDFMLIEIPKTSNNFIPDTNLHINIKIIECKMGFQKESQIGKAKTQIEKGLSTMCDKWNPNSIGVMHRYWMNQLYRAIIFSPLNLANTSAEYTIIRDKIYNILSGKVEFSWSGDIFAYWLDSASDNIDEYQIESDTVNDLRSAGYSVSEITCHRCGQMYIQRMLLPPEDRLSRFDYNAIDQDEQTQQSEIGEEASIVSEGDKLIKGSTIPTQSAVLAPFLRYLDNTAETTREESLNWFAKYFSISTEDQALKYESNSHAKWETVLDTAITRFRLDGLLENSTIGSFHITDLGKKVANAMNGDTDCKYSEILRAVAARSMMQVSSTETQHEQRVPEIIRNTKNEESVKERNEQTQWKPEGQQTEPTRLSQKQLKDVRLLLGKDVLNRENYYWEFGNKELNNRHLLINGNSGCGKTYCIQTLLMEAALQGVSAVVFDYTGGFANSKLDPVFKDTLGAKIEQRIVKTKKIPVNPFVKHDIQIDDDLFVPEENADVADKIAEIFKSVYSLGDQQRSAVYSAVMNGLKVHGEKMTFPAMVEELEKIGTNYAKSVITKIQTFTDFNPFTFEETFRWSDIRDSGGTVYVFQLIGYGREIQVLLTELLLWDIWSFCVKNGDESKPFILVLDEAQNLSHGEKSPSAKILTEGRKFGLSGWYATQFMKPQLSDDEIQRLQQASQKLYFCPPDDGVLTVAKNIDISANGTKEWSEKLKKLKKGECVTCGSMVRNGRWNKYAPRMIKVTSLQERLNDDQSV